MFLTAPTKYGGQGTLVIPIFLSEESCSESQEPGLSDCEAAALAISQHAWHTALYMLFPLFALRPPPLGQHTLGNNPRCAATDHSSNLHEEGRPQVIQNKYHLSGHNHLSGHFHRPSSITSSSCIIAPVAGVPVPDHCPLSPTAMPPPAHSHLPSHTGDSNMDPNGLR